MMIEDCRLQIEKTRKHEILQPEIYPMLYALCPMLSQIYNLKSNIYNLKSS